MSEGSDLLNKIASSTATPPDGG